MRLLLALTLVTVSVTLQAETVDQLEKQYAAQLEQAKKDHDTKVKSAKDQFVTKLKAEMTRLTKAGDLDGALKVRERIKQVEEGIAANEKPNNEKQVEQPAKPNIAGKRLKGKLYVSCNSNVEVFYGPKLIGKSSQHGQLVPIDVAPAEGEWFFFVSKGAPPGVSWIFVTEDEKHYAVSTLKNTPGTIGVHSATSTFADGAVGPEWVNNSLVKRMDDTLVSRLQKPESVMVKLKDGLTQPENASYKWTLKAEDLIELPAK